MKVTGTTTAHHAFKPSVTAVTHKRPPSASANTTTAQFSARAVALEAAAPTRNASLDATTRTRARLALADVDFRSIRYTDLVQVADELKGIGALSQEDYLDFIGPSPEFAMVNGERNLSWNEARDVIGMRRQDLEFSQSIGLDQRFVDHKKYFLSIYEGFQALRQA